MKQKSNILVDILLYGENRLNEGKDFTSAMLKSQLVSIGHPELLVDSAIKSFLTAENFIVLGQGYFRINASSYSILLSHRGLKAAWNGIWIAIGVAVLTTAASILVPLLVNNDPVSLTEEQFTALIRAIKNK